VPNDSAEDIEDGLDSSLITDVPKVSAEAIPEVNTCTNPATLITVEPNASAELMPTVVTFNWPWAVPVCSPDDMPVRLPFRLPLFVPKASVLAIPLGYAFRLALGLPNDSAEFIVEALASSLVVKVPKTSAEVTGFTVTVVPEVTAVIVPKASLEFIPVRLNVKLPVEDGSKKNSLNISTELSDPRLLNGRLATCSKPINGDIIGGYFLAPFGKPLVMSALS